MLYVIATVVLSIVSGSQKVIMIGGSPAPLPTFSGVFSSLANICIIMLVVIFRKKGLIASLILMISQLPIMILRIIAGNNLTSISGIFSNLLTIVAILIIYGNNVRIENYQARVREQAITDSLTGIPNRFACSEYAKSLKDAGEKYVIVSVDLNNFKGVNDTMGHLTGNEILIRIASRWKNAADAGLSGTKDFVARLGGDEFAIVITGYNKEIEAVKTIRYYEEILEHKITVEGCDYFMNASFGYAEYPTDTDSDDTLFTYADTAMSEIKRINGTEHILRFRPDLIKSEHILEIEREIRHALETDGIYYNLQPQYDIAHKLRGFEALARMKDSNGNIITPGEFIPVAEKIGLVDKIDSMVYRKSAEFISKAIKDTGADIMLCINASVRHLMKNDFLDELKELLETTGIPAGNLEIEITESIMLDSADKALECLQGIKDMGIQIAIDDFGTGYSSLSYLNKVPADILKIDKCFIDAMDTGESSMQYVAAIIAIGHIMNMKVLSEGVETKEQLDILGTIDCDYIQGFIWGRPLLPDGAYELIRQSATE